MCIVTFHVNPYKIATIGKTKKNPFKTTFLGLNKSAN